MFNRRIRNILAAWTVLGAIWAVGIAHAQTAPVAANDPCLFFPKSTVAINVTSATTTSLIALASGQPIDICGMFLNSVGGTSTIEYGTGATCGTGTTALTPAYAAASTVVIPSGTTQFSAPVGNRVCILSGTSTSATNGWLTYVMPPNG